MLEIILGWVGGVELLTFIPLIVKKCKRDKNVDNILLYGNIGSTSVPILDRQLQSKLGVELNWKQKSTHTWLVKTVRKLVNTKAFETITAYSLKKYWVLAAQQMKIKQGLDEDPKGIIA